MSEVLLVEQAVLSMNEQRLQDRIDASKLLSHNPKMNLDEVRANLRTMLHAASIAVRTWQRSWTRCCVRIQVRKIPEPTSRTQLKNERKQL